MRLLAAADGLRFAGKDPARERAALDFILARRAAATESLHERHMARLGVKAAPTRTVLHEVKDDDTEEEQLWAAWRAYSGS